MNKIIFEQLGNIVMIFFLTGSLIENTLINSNNNSLMSFTFHFGIFSILFILWIFIFGFIRLIYSKKNKNFSLLNGEFSWADEREKILSENASVFSYKSIISSLIVMICIFFIINILLDINKNQVIIISFIFLGTSIIIGYISYLLHWIYSDLKK